MAENPAVVFLLATHQQAEGLARAGTPGPWEPEGDDPTDDEVFTVHDGEHGDLVGNPVAYVRSGMWAPDPDHTQANMRLIASFADPTAVLRRVAAERKILAGHQPVACGEFGCDCHQCCAVCRWTEHDENGTEPAWGDVTRHVYPCRTVLLLAEAWGWTEGAPEQPQAEDVPAAYAAARAGAAQSLRAVEASLTEAADGAPLRGPDALHGLLAEMLEKPSPFASAPIRAYDLMAPPTPPPWDGPQSAAGCYAASWGWVHVQPGCRCAR